MFVPTKFQRGSCLPARFVPCCVHCSFVFALAGVRGEALASELLELDGLQQMLDDLWQWVEGSGEDQMFMAESLPVADDLDTIERQLSEHEVKLRNRLY